MDEKSRIEKVMQAENMNSAQFALETGIQTSTLSHILNGRNKVSLKVLQQILNRFKTISSDWLILGHGSMYRQEKNSYSPGLFDFDSENTYKSSDLPPKEPVNYSLPNRSVPRKTDDYAEAEDQTKINFPVNIADKPSRKIKRIIVYFDDNSFQEFMNE